MRGQDRTSARASGFQVAFMWLVGDLALVRSCQLTGYRSGPPPGALLGFQSGDSFRRFGLRAMGQGFGIFALAHKPGEPTLAQVVGWISQEGLLCQCGDSHNHESEQC